MRLFDFAFVPNYPEPLERLKQLAETEYWGRGGRMLKSYFNHMFDKVMDDGLMMIAPNGDSAVFHTGLQTDRLQQLYAVFVKNERDDAQEWFFRGFTTENNVGLGEVLNQFDELPERPRFLIRCEQAFYDLRVGPPECNWPELILDNISRVPRLLIAEATQGRIELPDMRDVGKEAYIESLEVAADVLRDDPGLAILSQEMELALNQAMDQLTLDYKLAVPTWHAKERFPALALPLRIGSKEPNIALAVSWNAEAGSYEPVNLLTPEMAYNNARLVAKPEATWLLKGNIPKT
ncbi:MAG: DUF3825 domain-containing protein [Flavobacteriales bacterium]|nr:DUF3825 domain-containing protein [Flavobacteriales bacterium]